MAEKPSIEIKSVQLLPGVHIPGIASATLVASGSMKLALMFDEDFLYVDTGKTELLVPVTALARIDIKSEKYAPKEPPKPAAAPAPAAPVKSDTKTFIKDPKTGAIVEK